MSPPSPSRADEARRAERLMLRVRDGDREAFSELYDTYGARVMRFLTGLCHDPDLAEELTQETFVRAWIAAPRWRPEGLVTTWIFQIAKRLWWKRARRRRFRQQRGLEAAQVRAARRPASPEETAQHAPFDARFDAERLRAAIAGLSPKLRLVFVLVRLTGLSYAETALVADLRPGTVKSRMAAAEARLRRVLEERDVPPATPNP